MLGLEADLAFLRLLFRFRVAPGPGHSSDIDALAEAFVVRSASGDASDVERSTDSKLNGRWDESVTKNLKTAQLTLRNVVDIEGGKKKLSSLVIRQINNKGIVRGIFLTPHA